MKSKKITLPPLLFGHLQAKIDLDLAEMQSTVSKATNWVSEYDALGEVDLFQHKISALSHRGVRIMTVASTPTIMKVSDPDYTIAIPIYGAITASSSGRTIEAKAGDYAIFYPVGKRHTEGGLKSVLLISLTPERLRKTIVGLLGESKESYVRLETTRLLPLHYGKTDFRQLAMQLCEFVNQIGLNPSLIESFGIDETICRLFVTMMAPTLILVSDTSEVADANHAKIQMLCEYIEANLGNPLHIGILETVSGMSSRSIQKSFRHIFQCGPAEWIAQRRLVKAHSLLSNPSLETKVSQVALECGYDNFSLFAKRYSELHQELPSKTLENAIKKN